jgi:hypothetical protein
VYGFYLHLMFLNLNESLAGILINGGKEQEELLHPLLRLQAEGDQAGVEEPLHQQPVLDAGHVVAVEDLVLDPLDGLLGGLGDAVRVGEVLAIDHGQAGHGLLPDLELLVQRSLLQVRKSDTFHFN